MPKTARMSTSINNIALAIPRLGFSLLKITKYYGARLGRTCMSCTARAHGAWGLDTMRILHLSTSKPFEKKKKSIKSKLLSPTFTWCGSGTNPICSNKPYQLSYRSISLAQAYKVWTEAKQRLQGAFLELSGVNTCTMHRFAIFTRTQPATLKSTLKL